MCFYVVLYISWWNYRKLFGSWILWNSFFWELDALLYIFDIRTNQCASNLCKNKTKWIKPIPWKTYLRTIKNKITEQFVLSSALIGLIAIWLVLYYLNASIDWTQDDWFKRCDFEILIVVNFVQDVECYDSLGFCQELYNKQLVRKIGVVRTFPSSR